MQTSGKEARRSDPLIGATLDGRYVIEARIGRGGMGNVYRARHVLIERRVAVKVLRQDGPEDQVAAQRFLREARSAAKVTHPNVVEITDHGVTTSGHTYLVMEYLEGRTLARRLRDAGRLDPAEATDIAVQIAQGLQAVHDRGIVHRDLKPDNVFLVPRGDRGEVVKIVDFGIARDQDSGTRLTQEGRVLGTAEYMAPEQATASETDHRVDVYALGCILYELLTGRVPFSSPNPAEIMRSHVYGVVVPPSRQRRGIPLSLEAVILQALAKHPAERHANMNAFKAALEEVKRQLASTGPGAAPAMPTPTPDAALPSEPAPAVDRAQPFGPAPTRKDDAPRGLGPALLVALGCAGSLAVVGIIALAWPSRPAAETSPPAPPGPVQAVAARPAAPPPPPPPGPPREAEVEIALRSIPSGAEVLEGTEVLGRCPLVLTRPRGFLRISLTVRAPGFQPETIHVVPSINQNVDVTLVARPSRREASRLRPIPVVTPRGSR